MSTLITWLRDPNPAPDTLMTTAPAPAALAQDPAPPPSPPRSSADPSMKATYSGRGARIVTGEEAQLRG